MLRTSFPAAFAAALVLAGCASSMTRAERLSLYQSNASEPLEQVTYFSPQGWEEVDSKHILVTMRPREQYLLRLSGPCLDYDNGAATLFFSSQIGGFIQPRFDRITFTGSPISCCIEEIRSINVDGVRAAMDARKAAI
jgi:hypothetical protein